MSEHTQPAFAEDRLAMRRGPRYDSRRYEHERTGEPMPAYVIGDFPLDAYVVEKARRSWDARPFRGSAGNPTIKLETNNGAGISWPIWSIGTGGQAHGW